MDTTQYLNESLYPVLIKEIKTLSSPLEPRPTGILPRLTALPDVRAMLFDVYGTLVVSGSGDISIASQLSNWHALTEALQWAGFSGKLDEAGEQGTAALIHAIRQTHAAQRQAGIEFPEVDIREEWQRMLEFLQQERLIDGAITPDAVMRVSVAYEYRVNPVWPMPGAVATIRQLRAGGVLLGIVSNAQFYTELMFPALLGDTPEALGFDPNLCVWSFRLREAKPSTALFRGVVERLQTQHDIAPEHILYVGNDKRNDLLPAGQCGLKTALFAGDQRSLRLRETDERCAALEPDAIITALAQIPALLQE